MTLLGRQDLHERGPFLVLLYALVENIALYHLRALGGVASAGFQVLGALTLLCTGWKDMKFAY